MSDTRMTDFPKFHLDDDVCPDCGHRHSADIGGICVGCPCGRVAPLPSNPARSAFARACFPGAPGTLPMPPATRDTAATLDAVRAALTLTNEP